MPDHRQAIADGWPKSINDRQARQDWGWQARFYLPAMVADMLAHLKTNQSTERVSKSISIFEKKGAA
jgi:hypothetical protein